MHVADYLAIARRTLARLQEPEPAPAPREGASQRVEDSVEQQSPDVAMETPCRCSKWPFPHLHNRGDREYAIREWNRDSRHKVEWIQ